MDIDGTLLDSHWKIPEANRAAITEAARRGIEVVLVTGRRFDFARPVAEQLDCELLLIVNNGALIKSLDGVTHLRHLLPRATAKLVLEAARDFRSGAAVIFDRPKERQVILECIEAFLQFTRMQLLLQYVEVDAGDQQFGIAAFRRLETVFAALDKLWCGVALLQLLQLCADLLQGFVQLLRRRQRFFRCR